MFAVQCRRPMLSWLGKLEEGDWKCQNINRSQKHRLDHRNPKLISEIITSMQIIAVISFPEKAEPLFVIIAPIIWQCPCSPSSPPSRSQSWQLRQRCLSPAERQEHDHRQKSNGFEIMSLSICRKVGPWWGGSQWWSWWWGAWWWWRWWQWPVCLEVNREQWGQGVGWIFNK